MHVQIELNGEAHSIKAPLHLMGLKPETTNAIHIDFEQTFVKVRFLVEKG